MDDLKLYLVAALATKFEGRSLQSFKQHAAIDWFVSEGAAKNRLTREWTKDGWSVIDIKAGAFTVPEKPTPPNQDKT